jgi:hypothetical protein
MSYTQAEILEHLGLRGLSPARATVEFAKLNMDEAKAEVLFCDFAGEDATLPPLRLMTTVVAYLVNDAAAGKPLDVAGCVKRAEKLAKDQPWNFSDAAIAERNAEKAALKAAKAEKEAAPVVPREVVQEDGSIKRRAGRPRAGEITIYGQIKELYAKAADRSKEVLIPFFVSTLQIGEGTATTYWHKARKEVKVAA